MTATERELGRWVAVYRDEQDARAAVDEVAARTEADAEVGSGRAKDQALHAEMQAEVDDAWASPGVGFFTTAHQMKGAVLFAVLGGLAGLVVGIPLGLLLWTHSGVLHVQVGIGALVGFLFGSTIGALLGGGFAMQSVLEQPAAQQGIAVSVAPALPGVREALERHDPIRLDRVVGDQRVETPVTEGPHGLRETVEELQENAADPRRR